MQQAGEERQPATSIHYYAVKCPSVTEQDGRALHADQARSGSSTDPSLLFYGVLALWRCGLQLDGFNIIRYDRDVVQTRKSIRGRALYGCKQEVGHQLHAEGDQLP